MKKLFLVLILFLSFQLSCSENETTSPSGDCQRTGAICNDGTRSNATGSGACSHHGGVKEWICK